MLRRRSTADKVRGKLREALRDVRSLPPSMERDEAYAAIAGALVWVKELKR